MVTRKTIGLIVLNIIGFIGGNMAFGPYYGLAVVALIMVVAYKVGKNS